MGSTGEQNCSYNHISTRANDRNLVLVEHLAGPGPPINPEQEIESMVTCKVIELWQSIQNDANQRQVKGSNFDLHLWFDTAQVQVVRTQQAVNGTDSFPLHFADPVGPTQNARGYGGYGGE